MSRNILYTRRNRTYAPREIASGFRHSRCVVTRSHLITANDANDERSLLFYYSRYYSVGRLTPTYHEIRRYDDDRDTHGGEAAEAQKIPASRTYATKYLYYSIACRKKKKKTEVSRVSHKSSVNTVISYYYVWRNEWPARARTRFQRGEKEEVRFSGQERTFVNRILPLSPFPARNPRTLLRVSLSLPLSPFPPPHPSSSTASFLSFSLLRFRLHRGNWFLPMYEAQAETSEPDAHACVLADVG